MHIICCIRAREKTDFKNPAKPVSLGVQPICEKNFMFEMTASFMMMDKGKALRAWLNGEGGDHLEPIRNRLRLAASDGTESLKAAWEGIEKKDRLALGAEFVAVLKSQAVAVSAAEAQAHQRYGHEATDAPEGREATLAALQAKCAPGNGYGVTEPQLLTFMRVKSFDEIADEELQMLNDTWATQVSMIAREGR